MMKVWPNRFPTEESAELCKNPKALAENVYFGRMGNDTKEKASAYIGRGFLQSIDITTSDRLLLTCVFQEVLDNPQLLEEDYAMDTALWFFKKNNLVEDM